MFGRAKDIYSSTLGEIREAGLYKEERIIVTPQAAEIGVGEGKEQKVLNFCANNYLGLSSHPEVIAAAHRAIDTHGFGMSSVRFICGTQDLHKELENKLSNFFGTEDTILYSSCFDANGGLFETLLGEEDAIISDALNHASIIDGIRLCKAERHRYANGDMGELEEALKKTQGKRLRMIATDGVFSMDGYLAKLDVICDLAEKYNAMVMVDDSHASGFIGKTGRGTPEHFGVQSRIDVMTSTLGKALGGAAGGFTTGKKEIIDLLRQRSRPYLFSNSIAPAIAGAASAVVDLLSSSTALRDKLMANAKRFRDGVTKAGLTVKDGETPIVPVMLGDAKLSQEMAKKLLDEGIYVIGFFFPVVPKGQARIRVQLSAQHTDEQIDRAVAAFAKVGKELGVIA
ncbi:2-amino-3-ketobutyrate coenzyme A ligase [Labilithrix luteola]|uniref:2-amino-3-ketobutyrate coenzyme A ligase n=1 Tax=Labilithrix luteola TaxID=1391654 RepID=A0A0K1PQJ4_9BACT|nr:glycine C-acetyltransferase [Labilithrix luteola]AKU95793.1 2-amino-3-ketobutyrate coenzyme A ligase [Labilithrix luteola]